MGYVRWSAGLLLCFFLFSILITAQEVTPQSSGDLARKWAMASVAAMGSRIPADLVATGSAQLEAGGKTDSATVTARTRGLDQSSEQIQQGDGTATGIVYSRGDASESSGSTRTEASTELATSSHSPDVPLILLGAALQDPETTFELIGQEQLDGISVIHIRFRKSFASQPKLSYLAEFSRKDLWVDASSGVPKKLSYIRRAARGAEPGILVEVFYSDYRTVNGVLYPFAVKKSLNGTPWATITLTSVNENVGLTDADFPTTSTTK